MLIAALMITSLAVALLFWGSDASGRSYIIDADKAGLTWDAAALHCLTQYGTTLATVIDTEDKATLQEAVTLAGLGDGNHLLLGLTDDDTLNVWEWADGSECSNSEGHNTAIAGCIDYWNTAEPNNNEANCGEAWFSSGVLFANDLVCTISYSDRYPACNTAVIVLGSEGGILAQNVEQYCLDTYNTNAASITNREDFQAVHRLCEPLAANNGGSTICCLGGDAIDGSWDWNDGSDNTMLSQTSTNWDAGGIWAVGQPNGGTQFYACLDATYGYGLHDCTASYACYPLCNSPQITTDAEESKKPTPAASTFIPTSTNPTEGTVIVSHQTTNATWTGSVSTTDEITFQINNDSTEDVLLNVLVFVNITVGAVIFIVLIIICIFCYRNTYQNSVIRNEEMIAQKQYVQNAVSAVVENDDVIREVNPTPTESIGIQIKGQTRMISGQRLQMTLNTKGSGYEADVEQKELEKCTECGLVPKEEMIEMEGKVFVCRICNSFNDVEVNIEINKMFEENECETDGNNAHQTTQMEVTNTMSHHV